MRGRTPLALAAWLAVSIFSVLLTQASLVGFEPRAALRIYAVMRAPAPGELLLWLGLLAPAFLLARSTVLATAAACVPAAVLSFANHMKLRELDQPLATADFYSSTGLTIGLHYVPGGVTSLALSLVAAAGAGIWLARRRSRAPRPPLARGARVALALAVVGAVAFGSILVQPRTAAFRLVRDTLRYHDNWWRPQPAQARHGLLTKLLMGIPYTAHRRSAGPGIAQTRALLAETPRRPPAAASRRSVVVILLEAFVDPAAFGIRTDVDPIPNFRRVLGSAWSGRLLVSVHGGETANTEFEVLTGIPLAYFLPGSRPYVHVVGKPMRALPRLFRENGYETVGFHEFARSAWNRNLVYPRLGFDDFVAPRTLEVLKPIRWQEDEVLYARVLERLRRPGAPKFLFALTMATHGPYGSEPATPLVRVTGGLPPSVAGEPRAALAVRSYLNKLAEADRALGSFLRELDHIQDVDLVLFGDHQPSPLRPLADALPPGSLLGKELPLFEDPALAQRYVTPVVVRPGERMPFPRGALIGAHCLHAALAASSALATSAVEDWLARFCDDHPLYSSAAPLRHQPPLSPATRNVFYDIIENSGELVSPAGLRGA